jgi:hypothetical protein
MTIILTIPRTSVYQLINLSSSVCLSSPNYISSSNHHIPICLSIRLTVHPSVSLYFSHDHYSVYSSINLSSYFCLSSLNYISFSNHHIPICLSICLTIRLSVSMSFSNNHYSEHTPYICLSVHQSVFIYLSFFCKLYIFWQSRYTRLSVHLSDRTSVHLSVL